MADFRGILRSLDDCPQQYEYASIGRGLDMVKSPYLALLANMTPADMGQAAQRNHGMWNDGFWARFAFVTPPPGVNRSRASFPEGRRVIPTEVTQPLVDWHKRLGVPTVKVQRCSGEGKRSDCHAQLVPTPMSPPCELGSGVRAAFNAYHNGLCDLIEESSIADLHGNYARFAEKALRVAMLLGSLANNGRVEMPQWVYAQTVAERWRAGLHSLYEQLNGGGPSRKEIVEERVLVTVAKLGTPTANDVRRFLHRVPIAETTRALEHLVQQGVLEYGKRTRNGTPRYRIATQGGEK